MLYKNLLSKSDGYLSKAADASISHNVSSLSFNSPSLFDAI